MFRRKPKPEVALNETAYARWLKACRPQPLAWFLGLSEADQQALATLGEAYTADLIVAVGLASQSEAAAYGVYAKVDREAAEAGLLQSLSMMAASKASSAPARRPGEPKYGEKPTTLSGVLDEQKQNKARADAEARERAPVFLGRKPDA